MKKLIDKYFYLELFIIPTEYFKVTSIREYSLDLGIPLIFVIVFSYIWGQINQCISGINVLTLPTIFISFLAITIGFTISTITLLATSNNNKLKAIITRRKLDGKEISLFRLWLVTLTYTVYIEIIALLLNIFIYVLANSYIHYILVMINLELIFHIIFLNLRHTVNLFYVMQIEDESNENIK